jgi:short-subunit dehydrogenase
MKETFTYSQKTALITGASSGLGETFARTLAALGVHMILVARSEEKLRILAKELSEQNHVRCEVIAADLSQPSAVAEVQQAVQERGLTVDILINNAGFGTYGPFDTLSPQRDHEEIMVNVDAVVGMTHAFLPAMVARRAGAIINVASMAAFLPMPYMAVYGASKAFVLSFSESLWSEYHAQGIRVVALCPGPVPTNFFDVTGNRIEETGGVPVTPERAVANALRALEKGKIYVVPDIRNTLIVFATSRLMPHKMLANVVAQVMKPKA